jgi:hypothetical protein
MPVETYAYDLVANVRRLVVPARTMSQEVCIHNHEHNQNHEIFLGNSGVTSGERNARRRNSNQHYHSWS